MTPLGAHSAGGSNVGLGIARPGCPLPLIEAPVSSDTPLNQRCSAGLRVTVRYAPSAGLGRGWGRRRLRQPDWRVKHEAVDFRRAGLRIYFRNKHLRRLRHFPPGPILVFVHGATYPASRSVDLELGGSPGWISARSAGYGRSTRPVAMDRPPDAAEPMESTADSATMPPPSIGC
jgi:hypothetical protein